MDNDWLKRVKDLTVRISGTFAEILARGDRISPEQHQRIERQLLDEYEEMKLLEAILEIHPPCKENP